MSHVPGAASGKLAWLQAQKAIGRLDGDDPDEIAEAEALLVMLVRLAGSKGRKEKYLDELLDEGLKGTFPASDPVSVGNVTSTEPPSRPIDREVVDLSIKGRTKAGGNTRASGDTGDLLPQELTMLRIAEGPSGQAQGILGYSLAVALPSPWLSSPRVRGRRALDHDAESGQRLGFPQRIARLNWR